MTSVFEREEYQSAIRNLGSAKARLQGSTQPLFSSTPAVSSSALVPEEEYVADDWLDDDLEEIQPKKKRRMRLEQNGIRGEDVTSSSAARVQSRSTNSDIVSRGNQGFVGFVFYSIQPPTSLCNSFFFFFVQQVPLRPAGVCLHERTARRSPTKSK